MKNIKVTIQLLSIFIMMAVFMGCTGSAMKHFDKKDPFMKNVQYSKVIKIVDKDIVKAIANITYLNSADSKKWDNGKQNFIIAVYVIGEDKKCCKLKLTVLKEKAVQLDENNIEYEEVILKPIEKKSITKDDPLYQNIPLRNNWAEYKLVSYANEDFKDIEKFTFQFKQIVQSKLKTESIESIGAKVTLTKE